MYCIYNFLLYSIIGFVSEIIFKVIFNFKTKTGILFGPYCPVYGFGISVIFIIYDKIQSKIKTKKIKLFLFFLISFIILSSIEMIGGYLIELIFHETFWNYQKFKFNINKYISIEVSTVWSILMILTYCYLKPITDKLYFKTKNNIIIIIGLIMLLDFFITNLFKFIK